jgi:transcriptional regulator with XRE-family HTH domain
MNERNPDQFREWLRRQLRARRMSLRQLAVHSGVSASTVSRVVRGDRQPSLRTALQLVRVLGTASERFDPAVDLGGTIGKFEPATEVERALRADSRMSETDVRRVMMMYHALRQPADSTLVTTVRVADRTAS